MISPEELSRIEEYCQAEEEGPWLADLPLLISSLREAQERIGKLEEALGFYADEHNWLRMDNSNSRASLNRGLIARAALESK